MDRKIITLISILFLCGILLPEITSAVSAGVKVGNISVGIGKEGIRVGSEETGVPSVPENFWGVVRMIISILLAIVFILGVIFLIFGGIMYITAGGDPGKVENAKNVLLYSVIGIGVAVLAWSLMGLVMRLLTGWRPPAF